MRITRYFGAAVLGGVVSGLLGIQPAYAACTYVDPHDLSGYQRWCSCVGGTFYLYQKGPACRKGRRPSPPPDLRQQQAYALNEQGLAAFREEEWDKAIDLFSRAYGMYPDELYRSNEKLARAAKANAEARARADRADRYNKEGLAAFKRGDYTSASASFGSAFDLDPLLTYRDNKEMVRKRVGKVDRTDRDIDIFGKKIIEDSIIRIPPSSLSTRNLPPSKAWQAKRKQTNDLLEAANSASENGQHRLAIEKYRQLIEQDPKNASHYQIRMGNIFFDQDEFALAEQAYRAGLEKDPNNDVVHFNLGLSLRRQGRYQEAEEAMKRAVELEPGYERAIKELAWLQDHNSSWVRYLDPIYNAIQSSAESGALKATGDFLSGAGTKTINFASNAGKKTIEAVSTTSRSAAEWGSYVREGITSILQHNGSPLVDSEIPSVNGVCVGVQTGPNSIDSRACDTRGNLVAQEFVDLTVVVNAKKEPINLQIPPEKERQLQLESKQWQVLTQVGTNLAGDISHIKIRLEQGKSDFENEKDLAERVKKAKVLVGIMKTQIQLEKARKVNEIQKGVVYGSFNFDSSTTPEDTDSEEDPSVGSVDNEQAEELVTSSQ